MIAAKTRFMVVVDHDREECSVYATPNEENARSVVEAEKQKGRNRTFSIFEAVDMNAARQRAEKRERKLSLDARPLRLLAPDELRAIP
jgi:hypothetical protein